MDWDKHLPSILAWGGSVVTGLFTLLGVWFANKSGLRQLEVKLQHENAKENREVQRARLEELYSLVRKWAAEVVIHHVTYRKVMESELTYNQALDITIKNDARVDASRMFTLAELYFPSAREALHQLKSLRDEAAFVQSDFKALYKQSGSGSAKHAKEITGVLERFNAAVDQYERSLAAHATNV